MDFNLQAYQADHLLHLSAKPERRLSILENARHRWLEMDGVVQSAMSLSQLASPVCPHQQSIASACQSRQAGSWSWGWAGAISPSSRGALARGPPRLRGSGCRDLAPVPAVLPPLVRVSPRLHHADALHFLHQSREQYDPQVLLDLFSRTATPAAVPGSALSGAGQTPARHPHHQSAAIAPISNRHRLCDWPRSG